MTRGQRLESAASLAMLPVGVVLGLLCTLGAMALLLLAVPAFLFTVGGAIHWWYFVWFLGGGAALLLAAAKCIEVVSAFDWRPLPGVLAVMTVTAVTSPFLW